jgi:hypothetical protein
MDNGYVKPFEGRTIEGAVLDVVTRVKALAEEFMRIGV